MIKSTLRTLICSLVAFLCIAGARAGEFGTKEEAVAMVERVATKLKADGNEKTLKAITDKDKDFVDRDLYAIVMTLDGVVVAHGATPTLVGKNLTDIKDQSGKYLIREIIEVAKSGKPGWVDYKWPNPVTKKIEDKSSYVIHAGDYAVLVGVYR